MTWVEKPLGGQRKAVSNVRFHQDRDLRFAETSLTMEVAVSDALSPQTAVEDVRRHY